MNTKILEIEKPPIGLRPKLFVIEDRIREIREAMIRYWRFDKEIPVDWTQEYDALIKEQKELKKSKI